MTSSACAARVVVGEELEDLVDGGARGRRRRLEHDPDALSKRGSGTLRVITEDADTAAVAAPIALQDLDGRRLAGPVRPEKREHLTDLDAERDSVQDLARAVRLAQAETSMAVTARPRRSPPVGSRARGRRSEPRQCASSRADGRPPPRSRHGPATTLARVSGVAPGARRSSAEDPELTADQVPGLAGAKQRAREDGVRLDARLPQASPERAGLLATGGCEGAQLVGFSSSRLGMAHEVELHGRRRIPSG